MFLTGHIRLKRFRYFVEGDLVLFFSNSDHYFKEDVLRLVYSRRMAENGFAPHLGNFADISYLVEN